MKIQNTEARIQKTEYITRDNPHLNPLPMRGEETKRRQRGVRGDLIGLVIAALFISACSGGGGGGSSPVAPSKTISFSGSSSGYNVYMAKNNSLSTSDIFAVDVKVDNVTGVYGAAFDVNFDSTKMMYSNHAAGSFLEQGGNTVTYNAATQSGNSSKLLVGISRQAGATGAAGSGSLVTLKFNVTSGGSIAISNSELKDSSNLLISGITWTGGTVTVQ